MLATVNTKEGRADTLFSPGSRPVPAVEVHHLLGRMLAAGAALLVHKPWPIDEVKLTLLVAWTNKPNGASSLLQGSIAMCFLSVQPLNWRQRKAPKERYATVAKPDRMLRSDLGNQVQSCASRNIRPAIQPIYIWIGR